MDYAECDVHPEIKYFRDDEDLNIYIGAVLFGEEMTIFNENFKSVGTVKTSFIKNDDCQLCIESQYEIEEEFVPPTIQEPNTNGDASSTSSAVDFATKYNLSSLLDPYFNVLRERIYTYTEQNDDQDENIVYLVKVGKRYYADTIINGHLEDKSYRKYDLDCMRNVVTDSLHLLLLRIIAIKSYRGKFKGLTIDKDGHLLPCVYTAEPDCIKYLRKKRILLVKVTREVFLENGKTLSSGTILVAKTGRTVKSANNYSRYFLATDPKHFLRESCHCDRPLPISVFNQCESVKNLFAQGVRNRIVEHKKYLEENPQVLDVLFTFAQEVLIRKPDNVVSFSMIFFSRLKNIVDKYKGI